jgi:hypothetical protein
MATLLTGLTTLLGLGGSAGVAGAAAAGTVAVPGMAGALTLTPAVASTGISLAGILQGTASVLGLVSAISAGQAEGEALDLQAADADREQSLETLQDIERRGSIKRAMVDALGAQDVAYAASGTDLSFGTARQARTDAFREADLALTTSAGTTMTRLSRLSERAANYRSAAKRARIGGFVSGLTGFASNLAGIVQRG